jgi:hypothetical protein
VKPKGRAQRKVFKKAIFPPPGLFARAHHVDDIPGWEKPGPPSSRLDECVRCKYVGTLPKELSDDTPHDARMSLLACSLNRCEAETGQRPWPAATEVLWRLIVILAERFPEARPLVRATREALSDAARSTGGGWPPDLADVLARVMPETKAGRKKSAARPAWEWTENVCNWFESTLNRHWNGNRYADAEDTMQRRPGYWDGGPLPLISTEHALIATWAQLKRDHPLVAAESNRLRGFNELTPALRERVKDELQDSVRPSVLAPYLAHLVLGLSEDRIQKHLRQFRRAHPPTVLWLPDNGREPRVPDNPGDSIRIYDPEHRPF